MRIRMVAVGLATVLAALWQACPAQAFQSRHSSAPLEVRIQAGDASLYSRQVGQGTPVVVLHGGPDFDQAYLLPDLDRLARGFRLIYYDQRGRGRSADQVRPDDVTLASEFEDLSKVMQHYGLRSAALLGHSWGALLALEYALRHPDRVTHLILMNPAPVSASDLALFRKAHAEKMGSDLDRQRTIIASAAYQSGDPETVLARYRLHFKRALHRPEDYEKLMAAMKAQFNKQGSRGILKARAVEDRLMRDTWQVEGYDLLPNLRRLSIPTLVITGEQDFIPVSVAANIARAIPDAQLVSLRNCGHFAYLECGERVRSAVSAFLGRAPAR